MNYEKDEILLSSTLSTEIPINDAFNQLKKKEEYLRFRRPAV